MALLPSQTCKWPRTATERGLVARLQMLYLNKTIALLTLLHLLPGHKASTECGPAPLQNMALLPGHTRKWPRAATEHGPTAGPHPQMAPGRYRTWPCGPAANALPQ